MGKPMNRIELATAQYQAIRDRILAYDPEIDEQTLADTVEGVTDLHEIIAAVIRAALTDEAISAGLQQRIGVMEARLERFRYRAAIRDIEAAKHDDVIAGFVGRKLIVEPDYFRLMMLPAGGVGLCWS